MNPMSPSKLLILNSLPSFELDTFKKKYLGMLRLGLNKLLSIPRLANMLSKNQFPNNEELRLGIIERYTHTHKKPYTAALNGLLGWHVRDYLSEIKQETLFVSAAQDYSPVSDKVKYAKKMPNARVAVIENSQHGTPFDQPEKLNQMVIDYFLENETSQLSNIMIYGCYGYSGALIAREALARGIQPILAGRRESSVRQMADAMGCASQVFNLDDIDVIAANIQDIDVVIHAAGPFSATAAPMLKACIVAKTHYVDITGEMDIFESAYNLDKQFKAAGVVAIPGVGFDIIPTDCVAAKLKELMPDADNLVLGFDSRSGMSVGTAKTSVEGMGEGGKVRRRGTIRKVPHAYKTRNIDFGDGEKLAVTIPWGDVATAYYSTEIPNIEVYIPGSPKMVSNMKKLNWIRPIFRLGFVQKMLKNKIEKSVTPPSDEKREKLPTYVWGEATNRRDEKVTVRIKTANGYTVTKDGAVTMAQKILARKTDISGYMTPSMLAGPNLVLELPGSGEFEITRGKVGESLQAQAVLNSESGDNLES